MEAVRDLDLFIIYDDLSISGVSEVEDEAPLAKTIEHQTMLGTYLSEKIRVIRDNSLSPWADAIGMELEKKSYRSGKKDLFIFSGHIFLGFRL